MTALESLLFWPASIMLAAAFVFELLSFTLGKSGAHKAAVALSGLTLVMLTGFGTARWINSGHPPFVTIFESMTLAVWSALALYHLLQWRLRWLQIMLTPLSLVGFLLLGWSSTTETAAAPLSAALDNVWLFIHASFATLGAATFLIATSLSVAYLVGQERLAKSARIAARVPEYKDIPRQIQNLSILGLVLWGVMIVSGSIWAHAAWGRYWAWDPIELWSLISWLLFGLVLHAKIGLKVSARVYSVLTIVATAAVIFALWGVGYLYETIHTYG